MKIHEAVTHFASAADGEADVTPEAVGSFASVASGGAPSFWKTLVLSGLNILRAACHLTGEESAAWDTVVALIEAL